MTFNEAWEKYESLDGRFDLVTNRLSSRSDMHAFMLLDRLVPGTFCLLQWANVDQVWFEVAVGRVEEAATEEELRDLICCGVFYDARMNALSLFI
jgi:hypothetical protein